jgi:hypothetical protein
MADIYSQVCEGDVKDYFLDHHKFCASQEDFSDSFPAIWAFDIKFCRGYMLTQMQMLRLDYLALFQDCKVQVMHATLLSSHRPQASSIGKASSSSLSPSTRYDPYSWSDRPFPKGTSSGAANSLCLICSHSGHLASGCSNGTTEKGKKVASGWVNGKLTLLSSRAELCLSWNLSVNNCHSNHNVAAFHHCSICGSKSHHASSHHCL